jgi:hypothetical protein
MGELKYLGGFRFGEDLHGRRLWVLACSVLYQPVKLIDDGIVNVVSMTAPRATIDHM